MLRNQTTYVVSWMILDIGLPYFENSNTVILHKFLREKLTDINIAYPYQKYLELNRDICFKK